MSRHKQFLTSQHILQIFRFESTKRSCLHALLRHLQVCTRSYSVCTDVRSCPTNIYLP